MGTWRRIADAIERDGRVAMVTVAATKGSAPREAGARMIVQPDGGFTGTIGGGTLEWRAIAMAQAKLARHVGAHAELKRFVLGPDMGQCCGGQVELLFEVLGVPEREQVDAFVQAEAAGTLVTRGRIDASGVTRVVSGDDGSPSGATGLSGNELIESFGDERRRLYLFGAGHVGRALVLALAPLPFDVQWVDPRPDAFPAHVPRNVTVLQANDPVAVLRDAPGGGFVLVMSHSHQLDLALVDAALADDRFPYVGLIGSKSKRARFERRLSDAGVPKPRIAAMICPIGVPGVKSKLPAAIAAATVAQMLIRDEALRHAAVPADAIEATRGRAG
jgi:xanthine dehydrogenase accessory factor